jgi:hypothetical protein
MKRRAFILAGLSAPFLGRAGFAATLATTYATTGSLTVAKTPTCGCCGDWVEHMRAAGFAVDVSDLSQEALWTLKDSLSITPELSSCHTGQIAGYFIEGHVPASDVARLLSERPDALGLTVPGMPIGSPGMEMGTQKDAYDTLLVLRDGTTQVFQSHA